MSSKNLLIGWAQTDITPDRPVYVFGQLYQRISSYVRDPLSATALAIESNDQQLVILSADIAGFSDYLIEQIRKKLRKADSTLNDEAVCFCAIHTHNSVEFSPGATVFELLFGKNYVPEDIQPVTELPDDFLDGEEGLEWLSEKLSQAVLKAWDNRQPGGISYAQDYAAIGHNRRPQFMTDGKKESRMYGTCSERSFVGMEGSVDHTANFLYTWDQSRNLTGIVAAIPCPSQVHELHCYITADYWKESRESLCEAFGSIFVLPLCAFAGDQNPLDLVRVSKYNEKEFKVWNSQAAEAHRNIDLTLECSDIGNRIADAALRAFRKASVHIEYDPEFKHKAVEFDLPVRKVSETEYIEAKTVLDSITEEFSPVNKMGWADVARTFEHVGVIARWERQNTESYWSITSHIVRFGRAVMVTVPFEPFVEYGFRLRARLKADDVFPIQLSCGNYGYVPTREAVAGGSYSGKPASTPISPEGGDIMTERLIEEADNLFK